MSAPPSVANGSTQSPLDLTVVTPTLGSCSVQAGGLLGLEFCPITVEVAARRGPSCFHMAGLAETAVREARIRLHSALSHLGITLDEYALTVNLAPAHLRKSGTGLDLAIAVGILGAIGRIAPERVSQGLFLGEVSLAGGLRAIPGVLPLLLGAVRHGTREVFVPMDNAREAFQPHDLTVYPLSGLEELLSHLQGKATLSPVRPVTDVHVPERRLDFADVRGQRAAKRALLIAASGGHHILLIGPPGSGKSLLARRLPGLLPPLSREEALETTCIHSVSGLLRPGQGLLADRPFRAPHHTISEAGLVGGGSTPRPGELSLAHHGVLFLDELPEFRRSALESLRQPLEDREVHIVRARCRATFPARPTLVCAMNPCPCGHWGNPLTRCRCSRSARLRYLNRVSGPLLDRIDLHVPISPVPHKELSAARAPGEESKDLHARVLRARALQENRLRAGRTEHAENALLSLDELERVVPLSHDAKRLVRLAMDRAQLSARGYVRMLRISRTIADLDEKERVGAGHVGEALRYRMGDLDRH